jgi:hypothetical protein
MAQLVSQLTQSRFYSPAFNAAVFDGPIRIYFAQHQESLALQVYFRLQNHLKEAYQVARTQFKQSGHTIFLMLYPTVESFEASFSKDIQGTMVVETLGEDFVIGVRGPLLDDEYDSVFVEVQKILRTIPMSAESPVLAHADL